MVRGHSLWVEFEMVEMAEIGGMVEMAASVSPFRWCNAKYITLTLANAELETAQPSLYPRKS